MSETMNAEALLKEHAHLKEAVQTLKDDNAQLRETSEKWHEEVKDLQAEIRKDRQSIPASGLTRKSDLFVNVPAAYQRNANTAMEYLLRCTPENKNSDLARLHELHDTLAFAFSRYGKDGLGAESGSTMRQMRVPDKIRDHPKWREYTALRASFIPKNLVERAQQGMDTQTTGEGTEWVPYETFSTSLIDLIRDSSQISSLFIQRDMPTAKLTLPRKTSNPTTYLVAESTESSGSNYNTPTQSGIGTAQFSYDARKLMAESVVSNELMEDSPIMGAEMGRQAMIQAFADSISEVILDGDTAGTHQDTDVTAATDRRKAWLGLRAYAYDNSFTAGASGAISPALILTRRGNMGVHSGWISNRPGLVTFMGPLGYAKLLQHSSILTADVRGGPAPNVTGDIVSVGGIPIAVTEHIRENLAATGLYDGSTTDQTTAVLADTGAWGLGTRVDLQIRISDILYARGDMTTFIGRWRGDFEHEYASGAHSVDVLYDIT